MITLLLLLLLGYTLGVNVFLDNCKAVLAARLVCRNEIYEVDLTFALKDFNIIEFDVLLFLRFRFTYMLSMQL